MFFFNYYSIKEVWRWRESIWDGILGKMKFVILVFKSFYTYLRIVRVSCWRHKIFQRSSFTLRVERISKIHKNHVF